jgi:hypothetical protein
MAKTANEFSRLLVTAADSTGAGNTVPRWATVGASDITIGVLCTVASSVLTGRLLSLDSQGNVVGCTVELTFTAGSAADFGTAYIGIPSIASAFKLSGAYSVAFIVDSVTGSDASFGIFARTANANNPQ